MKTSANSKVDSLIASQKQWRDEFSALRAIILRFGLTEDVKWEKPCYALDGTNVVLIHGFKAYCALLFFKGALMKDPDGLLVQQTMAVQAARQIRFQDAGEIRKLSSRLKAYVAEAIAVEHSGAKVSFKSTAEFIVPDEFKRALVKSTALKKAFDALTPGRQRGYLLHFSSAKQAATREARVLKCVPDILAGKGLDD